MLTRQQKLYAEGRAAGLQKKLAAIAAGCPEGTASQAASRYERNPEIQAHMARHGLKPVAKPVTKVKPEPIKETPVTPEVDEQPAQETPKEDADPRRYSCPIAYMQDLVNNDLEDPKLRLDAAKAWATLTVAKPGEKGKKETQKEKAEEVAARFAPASAPKLKAVK